MSARAAAESDLWAGFIARAEVLGTRVLHAASYDTVAAHLDEAGSSLVVTASLAARFPAAATGRPRVQRKEVADGGAAAAEVAAAAAFAVAETGSLALNEPREDRGACFLADRLWLLVPADQLLPTLDEAFERLANLVKEGGRHPLLMSGPSRTADIERVLTIGVHGPRALVAIIVDTSVR